LLSFSVRSSWSFEQLVLDDVSWVTRIWVNMNAVEKLIRIFICRKTISTPLSPHTHAVTYLWLSLGFFSHDSATSLWFSSRFFWHSVTSLWFSWGFFSHSVTSLLFSLGFFWNEKMLNQLKVKIWLFKYNIQCACCTQHTLKQVSETDLNYNRAQILGKKILCWVRTRVQYIMAIWRVNVLKQYVKCLQTIHSNWVVNANYHHCTNKK
jgi:hypothetical protein